MSRVPSPQCAPSLRQRLATLCRRVRLGSNGKDIMKRSVLYPVALLAVIVLSALYIRHEWFFFTADGVISPKTAVSLGLIDEKDEPWVGGIVFKQNAAGGYDFRDGHVALFGGKTGHTEIDVLDVCIKAGECQVKKP